MNALTPTPRPERIQVLDAIPILDTGRFEQMQRIASVMARTPLVPDCLRFHLKDDGKKGDLLPTEEAVANCFLVVNQSVRWGLDPFAVASCCSLVRGKLMFEGKLVAAVLAAKLNEQLIYEWNDKQGDAFGIRVTGSPDSAGNPRVIEGTVGQWKTNGAGSPWSKPADHRRQLAYRGTRDWTRLYEPAVLLGVYTPDEMDGLEEGARAARATPVSGPPRAVRQTAAAQIEHQPVQQVVPAAETKPAETVSATSQQAKPQEQATKHVVGQTPQDIENARELEAAVASFERQAGEATTRQDLDAAEELIATYQDNDLFGLAQRNRISTAWEDADARIQERERAASVKSAPVEQKPAGVDTTHPAYLRGVRDRERGVGRCLNPEIKGDPAALALWEAGHQANRDMGA